MSRLLPRIGLLLSLPWLVGASDSDNRIQSLLDAKQAPEGVVFEMIAWRDRSWDWAAPLLRDYVDRLRLAYPRLDIALVSHGAELFELSRSANFRDEEAIGQLAELANQNVTVHVAGDYASWKRLGPKDFPDFIDVAASGQAQLSAYIELGFEPVKLENPNATD